MKKIGLLSDTHGFIDSKVLEFFGGCDEIWHAGDVGDYAIIEQLQNIAKVRAVYGNIDGEEVRASFPEHLRFFCEKVEVWITHIGGYPGRYDRNVKNEIRRNPPQLFIAGHSHILKVLYDKKLQCLHINPGAAGKFGFHKVRTAVRFVIDNQNIKDLEVLELQR